LQRVFNDWEFGGGSIQLHTRVARAVSEQVGFPSVFS
jgi:hypothetical protein